MIMKTKTYIVMVHQNRAEQGASIFSTLQTTFFCLLFIQNDLNKEIARNVIFNLIFLICVNHHQKTTTITS